jgi:membrane protein implicated in regulation of membrane protease activity
MNACAAVVGSALAVVLAMSLGFRAVTHLALATYVVGARAARRRLRRQQDHAIADRRVTG